MSFRPLRLLAKATLFVCVLGLCAFFVVAFVYLMLAGRYDLGEIAKAPTATMYYDRSHQEIHGQNGGLITRAEVPDFLVKALLAREDARFFQHNGVDIRGLFRAFFRNIKDKDYTQGASTLTMQLARNTFQIKQKSLHRKLLETALALRIESRYSKDEILTNYLNRIYFGAGAWGIEQAAHAYFGKTTQELTEGESSLLVGIIRGPHLFSPFRNFPKTIEQRNQTLNRMVAMGLIDQNKREQVAKEIVYLADENERANQSAFALQAVSQELDRILDLEKNNVRANGLQVFTTLDNSIQQRLETLLLRSVQAFEKEQQISTPLQYSAITLDARTGGILARIGGRNYEQSNFDRAHSRRDLGSAFEPFLAAAVSERGKSVFPGQPVQMGRQLGAAEVIRIVKRCGISGPFLKTEDLFRGSVSATPKEVAIALAVLANEGKRPTPELIEQIRDANGKTSYKTEFASLVPAISPAGAQAATQVFYRVSRKNPNLVFTGSTGSGRDAWILHISKDHAVTVIWFGYDKPATIAPEPTLNRFLKNFAIELCSDEQ